MNVISKMIVNNILVGNSFLKVDLIIAFQFQNENFCNLLFVLSFYVLVFYVTK